jgi:hypothetical protein
MRGMTEFIKAYDSDLRQQGLSGANLADHLTRIGFLQHERLVHLIVMLFVALSALICLGLYLFSNLGAFLIAFALLLILTLFYILHYYRLENSVIRW